MNEHDTTLPRFVRDLLASPPRRGEGLNIWFFRAARLLHHYRTPAEILQLLDAATAGESLQPGEIERAVTNSKNSAWKPGQQNTSERSKNKKWPLLNAGLREDIITGGVRLTDLRAASPSHFDDNRPQTEKIIDLLFPGNPLLCVGKANYRFTTKSREKLRGYLSRLALIVPSPMTASMGRTKDGRESEHTLSNTGPRRFLVIEQDKGTADEQAAVLMHLAELAPLVLALHSGGKSIHGWFSAVGQSEDQLLRFMRYAVSLGADSALWTRSQFARMPDGTRENGNRQAVYFLNREVVQ